MPLGKPQPNVAVKVEALIKSLGKLGPHGLVLADTARVLASGIDGGEVPLAATSSALRSTLAELTNLDEGVGQPPVPAPEPKTEETPADVAAGRVALRLAHPNKAAASAGGG